MEPQENLKLSLGRAVRAHEEAAALLHDLMEDESDPAYADMLENLKRNLERLRTMAAAAEADERV